MRVRLAILVLVGAALLAAPASSPAAKTFTTHAGGVTYARVHASDGYRVNFSENEHRYFEVRVVGHHSSTRYDLRGGPVAGGRVSANLGVRGKFDLRFVPAGRLRRVPVVDWCTGPVGHWQAGYLVGRVRFRAEGGFTAVRLRRVPAARESWASLRCRYTQGLHEGHPKRRREELSASASGAHRETFGAVLFYRHSAPRARRVRFRATRRERAGRIQISREVKVDAPESSFASVGGPKMPEEVELTPPAPFSGSAAFIRTPESSFEWRSDLAVTFPGLGTPARLAGPRFSASVCALGGCVIGSSESLEKLVGKFS